MLTVKNKEQFDEWCCSLGNYVLYNNKYLGLVDLDGCFIVYFDELPFEMRLGVYLAYYDSKGFTITLSYNYVFDWYFKIHLDKVYIPIQSNFNTRNEALKEALKEADKLMNSN